MVNRRVNENDLCKFSQRPQKLKWVYLDMPWCARTVSSSMEKKKATCIETDSFIPMSLSSIILIELETVVSIYLSFLVFLLRHQIIRSVQNFFSIRLVACFSLSLSRAWCNFLARRCLLKCVLTTARCHRASSFDINRTAVCHFHISSRNGTRNELSSLCFSN